MPACARPLPTWPRSRSSRRPGVEYVGQNSRGAWAVTADQRRFDAAVVIGADGYQSVVRRSVSPERPDAIYANYLAWVGFADERAVTSGFPRDLAFLQAGDYYLLGFPLPGRDGSSKPGPAPDRLGMV
jgi:2-polyprenyl-6-methoxyphenol hydroxylase-like FAD-dependent oxidoreductase